MAGELGTAYVLIRSTDKGFEAEVVSQINKATTGAEKKAKPLKLPAPDTSPFSKFGSVISTQVQGFLGPVGAAIPQFKQLGLTGSGAFGSVGLAAAGAGAAIGLLALQGVHQFVELTSQIRQFKAISGTTAEEASRMVGAFNTLGISSESVGRGIFKLSHITADQKIALDQLGVSIAKDAKGNLDVTQTFFNVADAAHKAAGGTERNSIAFAAFGRAGLTLLPVLARGSDELRKYFALADERHEVFSDADLEKGRQFQIATRELGQSFKAFEIQLGEGVLPALQVVLQALSKGIGLIGGLVRAIGTVPGIHQVFHRLAEGAANMAGESANAAGALGSLGDAGDEAASGLEQSAQAAKDLQAALDSLGSTQTATVQTVFTLHDANLALKDAEAAVTAAHVQERGASQSGQAARRAHIDQARQERQAAQSLADAQQKVAEATQHVTEALAANHAEELASAGLDVRDAQLGLADAQTRLNEILSRSGAGGEDVVRSQLALADAQKAASDATANFGESSVQAIKANLDLADAQRAANEATRQFGPDGEEAVRASIELERAKIRLAQASREGGDIETAAADSVKAAQRELADAQRAVAEEQDKINEGFDRSTAAGASAVASHTAVQHAQDALLAAQARVNDAQARQNALLASVDPTKAGEALTIVQNLYDALHLPIPDDVNGVLQALTHIQQQASIQYVSRSFVGPLASNQRYQPLQVVPNNFMGPLSADQIRANGTRDSGGPVEAGRAYRIGREELFVPGVNGRVLTPEQISSGPLVGSLTMHLTVGDTASAGEVRRAAYDGTMAALSTVAGKARTGAGRV